jgi:hypothetical protein
MTDLNHFIDWLYGKNPNFWKGDEHKIETDIVEEVKKIQNKPNVNKTELYVVVFAIIAFVFIIVSGIGVVLVVASVIGTNGDYIYEHSPSSHSKSVFSSFGSGSNLHSVYDPNTDCMCYVLESYTLATPEGTSVSCIPCSQVKGGCSKYK